MKFFKHFPARKKFPPSFPDKFAADKRNEFVETFYFVHRILTHFGCGPSLYY